MATITNLVYNCTPDSLGGINQEDFVEAFENELRVNPLFRECFVEVTFRPALVSELVTVAGVDLSDDPVSEYSDRVRLIGESAFASCCR